MWSNLILGSVAVLGTTWLLAFCVPGERARLSLSYFLPLLVIGVSQVFGHYWNAYGRLAICSLTLLYTFKGASLLRLSRDQFRSIPTAGLLYFSLFWPGIDPAPFQKIREPAIEDHRRFAGGIARMLVGGIGFLLLAGLSPRLSPDLTGWLAIFAILLTAHLGLTSVLVEITRAFGWKVHVLFDSPHHAHSLSNFWSRRWNRPFVEMNRIFFMPWLSRKFGTQMSIFCIFIVSGLLHELAISFPAQTGWGGPLLYFSIQGFLVLLERKLPFHGRLWVGFVVLAPLPILFHSAFRSEIVLPYVAWTHGFLVSIGIYRAASFLIFSLSIAQLCVLAASFQVPTRLRWKEELASLSPLNQKLMWTYGSFIVFTIVSWGILTAILHDEILRGSRPGLALCTVISLFWGARLLVDTFYFSSDDWPKGPFMQIGHILLNCLFTFVLIGYLMLLICHFLRVLS